MKYKILLFVFVGLLIALNAKAQDFWEILAVPENFAGRSMAANSSGWVFIGTNDGVYRSCENGLNMSKIGLENVILGTFVDFNNYIFAGSGPIYFSIDNGEKWNEIITPSDVNEIYVNDDFILYGNWGGIYTSHDFGSTWDQSLLLDLSQVVNSIVEGEAGILFAGITAYFGNNGVYRSMDNGDTWEQAGLHNEYISSLAVNSNGVLFAGSRGNYFTCLGGVFKSEDMGNTWIKLTEDIWVTSLVIDTNDIIYAGTEVNSGQGGIFRSADNGQTWEYICSGMGAYPSVEGLCLSPDGYLYAYDTKLYRTAEPVYTSVNDNREVPATGTISFYPNPATDQLTGRLTRKGNCDGKYSLSIVSMSGQVLMEEEISLVSGMFTIPVTSLPAGLYVVRLTANTGIFQARFVKR